MAPCASESPIRPSRCHWRPSGIGGGATRMLRPFNRSIHLWLLGFAIAGFTYFGMQAVLTVGMGLGWASAAAVGGLLLALSGSVLPDRRSGRQRGSGDLGLPARPPGPTGGGRPGSEARRLNRAISCWRRRTRGG